MLNCDKTILVEKSVIDNDPGIIGKIYRFIIGQEKSIDGCEIDKFMECLVISQSGYIDLDEDISDDLVEVNKEVDHLLQMN